jgi:hypothetical protein
MLCWPTTALSEVRRIDENTVSMHVNEYRFFIMRIKTLEAGNEALKQVLQAERASSDEVIDAMKAANDVRLKEREASEARIATLEAWIKRYKTAQWIPGIISGGGISTGGDIEGFIGIGWKIDLW